MEVDTGSKPSFSHLARLVHLDLKGAPPRISYFEKLFPLLHELGATGLLIEYEDMFPYSRRFKDVPLPYAYSATEIQQLLKLAQDNQLSAIPLVQTFGHFEFLLKKPGFIQLREITKFPNALCPCHPDSLSCVVELVGQIVELHPNCKQLHIGADEVWNLGECDRCQVFMRERRLSRSQLFLWFVTSLLRELKVTFKHLSYIMWEDMLRTVSLQEIKDSGLHELVEPMVWHYLPSNQFALDNGLWLKYMSLFSGIWVASSFKGSTSVDQIVAPPGHHLSNQQAWLAVLTHNGLHKWAGLRGIALTGWQRFDHFTVLCELLPVALPSLAVSLQCLILGEHCPDGHHRASVSLGFKELIPLETNLRPIPLPAMPSFPGAMTYLSCLGLANLVAEWRNLKNHPSLRGGFTSYQITRNKANPLHVEQFLPQAIMLLFNLESLKQQFEIEMSSIFYPDTIQEFLECQLQPTLTQLQDLVSKAKEFTNSVTGNC